MEKKMKSRIITIAVMAVCTVSLTACLGNRPDSRSSAAADAAEEMDINGKTEAVSPETEPEIKTEAGTEPPAETRTETTAAEEESSTKAGTREIMEEFYRRRAAAAEMLPGVTNLDQFDFYDGELQLLKQNHFFVAERSFGEFYTVYESNSYWNMPSFVTVDSLMHTYHLYFSLLMKNVEKNYVAPELCELSREMMKQSAAQLDRLQGTEWEFAAKRNLAFFTVGCRLQDPETETDPRVAEIADTEYGRIMAAGGKEICSLFPDVRENLQEKFLEDYSQYKPRGNYAGDPVLEAYFRAMMWYGRISFLAEDENTTRSALLITLALDGDRKKNWEEIYKVTAFFAGASDDNTYYDYAEAIGRVYPEGVTVKNLPGDTGRFERFLQEVKALKAPKINSLSNNADAENNTAGRCFRFMGQRYSLDGEIYERLTEYPGREIPSALDVPAVLGSAAAEEILTEKGDMLTEKFRNEFPKLKAEAAERSEEAWKNCLSSEWMYTLTPLLQQKGAGYPEFMQNREWERKTLETFEASYAEMKHDTVLYAKQLHFAEGDGEESYPVPRDDRGYVEPEPEVFARFAALSSETRDGLVGYGMLAADQKARLDELTELADALMRISEKELNGTERTEEEYQLIREYGRTIEGFWEDYIEDKRASDSGFNDCSPALVTDIASGSDLVLNIATGNPQEIYVLVPVDGSLRIATGTVYRFYEFETGAGERLTDGEWKDKMGFSAGWLNEDLYDPIDQPAWTQGYRVSSSR